MDDLLNIIEKLEYYQRLMAEMVPKEGYAFHRLVIKNGLTEEEVEEFYNLCDVMSKKIEKQKAEEFVYNTPLFKEFEKELHSELNVIEVVDSCLAQNIYPTLMQQLKKSL
ncbi:DUF1878 family protein [Rossellomorea aquimaris]|uniref:DUF1878 family protein n=1 Tax=Rossellomorea aquimaris TaxID=189382 RepID=UPI0007D0A240|nr:DUF1878 family protein [Rossellomorea aquimaris]